MGKNYVYGFTNAQGRYYTVFRRLEGERQEWYYMEDGWTLDETAAVRMGFFDAEDLIKQLKAPKTPEMVNFESLSVGATFIIPTEIVPEVLRKTPLYRVDDDGEMVSRNAVRACGGCVLDWVDPKTQVIRVNCG